MKPGIQTMTIGLNLNQQSQNARNLLFFYLPKGQG